jgi:LuxR family maltose regulon positive regulatory protein
MTHAYANSCHETFYPSASASRCQPPLIEPLSRRELEVLQLMAQGLSNQEMSERLFLALDTVKGHNRYPCWFLSFMYPLLG